MTKPKSTVDILAGGIERRYGVPQSTARQLAKPLLDAINKNVQRGGVLTLARVTKDRRGNLLTEQRIRPVRTVGEYKQPLSRKNVVSLARGLRSGFDIITQKLNRRKGRIRQTHFQIQNKE